jgi:hypothetical protein
LGIIHRLLLKRRVVRVVDRHAWSLLPLEVFLLLDYVWREWLLHLRLLLLAVHA